MNGIGVVDCPGPPVIVLPPVKLIPGLPVIVLPPAKLIPGGPTTCPAFTPPPDPGTILLLEIGIVGTPPAIVTVDSWAGATCS